MGATWQGTALRSKSLTEAAAARWFVVAPLSILVTRNTRA